MWPAVILCFGGCTIDVQVQLVGGLCSGPLGVSSHSSVHLLGQEKCISTGWCCSDPDSNPAKSQANPLDCERIRPHFIKSLQVRKMSVHCISLMESAPGKTSTPGQGCAQHYCWAHSTNLGHSLSWLHIQM